MVPLWQQLWKGLVLCILEGCPGPIDTALQYEIINSNLNGDTDYSEDTDEDYDTDENDFGVNGDTDDVMHTWNAKWRGDIGPRQTVPDHKKL